MSKQKNRTLDKKDREALQKIADRLPRVEIPTKDGKGIPAVQAVFGSQLIEKGINEVEGKKVVPGKRYANKLPNASVNHFNELEKAFLRNGMDGVNSYVDKVNNSI